MPSLVRKDQITPANVGRSGGEIHGVQGVQGVGGCVRPLDSPSVGSAPGSVPDHRDIVWHKLQELKGKYLEDMKELYTLLTQRGTMPMPPEDLQKLESYKHALHRMIPYLTVPKERVPREFSQDKVEAFEKQIVNIMERFRRRRQPSIQQPALTTAVVMRADPTTSTATAPFVTR